MIEKDQTEFKFLLLSKSFALLGELVKAATLMFCVYCVYLSIVELAGKETNANLALLLDYAAKEKESSLPWFLVFLFGAWGYGERRLRKKKVEFFHQRNKKLEMRLDQNRTSSRLTKQGTTNPEDKL